MRRWAGLVTAGLLLVAGCGGGDDESSGSTSTAAARTSAVTSTAAPTTSAPATTIAPTTTAVPTTAIAAPGSPVTLLVADLSGLRLWTEGGAEQWLIRDRAMKGALPDRVGGVVYQQVETGMFRMVLDPPTSWEGEVRWEWIGAGTPRPIRRLSGPGGSDEIVVQPARDQTLRLVDTAMVDGRPHLAYLRSTHQLDAGATSDTSGLNGTRTTELVVRDLTTGSESVVWTQDDGWEAGSHSSKLGDGVVADVWTEYGDVAPTVGLYDLQGERVAMPYRPPESEPVGTAGDSSDERWVMPGTVRADLAPDGTALAYAHTPVAGLGSGEASSLTVVAVDPTTWTEDVRVSVPLGADMGPSYVDAAGGRVLVGLAAWQWVWDLPTLRLGDEGDWVRELQSHLMIDDTPVVADGVFGPATQAAVMAWQQRSGMEPTGVVDSGVWGSVTSGSRLTIRLAPLLVEPDGSSRLVAAPGTGFPAVELTANQLGHLSLWTG